MAKGDSDVARFLEIMREQGRKDNPSLPEIAVMTGSNSCIVGELPLDGDNLLMTSSLKDEWGNNMLSKGDLVLVTQVAEQDMYVIICKVVNV